jgi:hypothetical protein
MRIMRSCVPQLLCTLLAGVVDKTRRPKEQKKQKTNPKADIKPEGKMRSFGKDPPAPIHDGLRFPFYGIEDSLLGKLVGQDWDTPTNSSPADLVITPMWE